MSETPLVSLTVDETVILLGVLRMVLDGDVGPSANELLARTTHKIEDRLTEALANRTDPRFGSS